MKHTISVVLPNYNGHNLLERNIPSLIAALDGLENEIIVVDDCSSDDSVQFLKTTYPEINVVKNQLNYGFSTTCNIGMRAARHELLCIVNTDVTFTPDYFANLIHEFNNNTIFAAKGNIINYDKSFDDVINIDRMSRMYYKRGFLRFDHNNSPETRTLLDGVNKQFISLGCCFVCNKEIMLKLEGFDTIYSPFYWEDSDLPFRAMNQGYKLVYTPNATVYHQASSTISKYRSNIQRQLISNRNKFIFTWHHLGTREIIFSHIPITFFNLLTRWIVLDWKYYAAFSRAIFRELKFNRQLP